MQLFFGIDQLLVDTDFGFRQKLVNFDFGFRQTPGRKDSCRSIIKTLMVSKKA